MFRLIKWLAVFLFCICFQVVYAESWQFLGGKGLTINHIAIDNHNPNKLLCSTENTLYRSVDKGNNWVVVDNQIQGKIKTIAINPQSTNVIYVGAENSNLGEIYKSEDGGISWRKYGDYTGYLINALAINHYNPDVLYVIDNGGDGRFYKSINGGENWFKVANIQGSTSPATVPTSIVVDPQNPNIVYVTTFQSIFDPTTDGIFKSIDQGTTWEKQKFLGNYFPFYGEKIPIAIDPQNTNIVYVGHPEGKTLFKSSDGGTTWENIFENTTLKLLIETIAIDPHRPNIVYLGTRNGLYRTTNRGETWQLISNLENNVEPYITSIAIDPHNPDNVYLGIKEKGIYRLETNNSCIANYDTSTSKATIPCLTVDKTLRMFEVELKKNNNMENMFFEISAIK
jgi:photosystem II stability/assembly factor-like uncharacterized protein